LASFSTGAPAGHDRDDAKVPELLDGPGQRRLAGRAALRRIRELLHDAIAEKGIFYFDHFVSATYLSCNCFKIMTIGWRMIETLNCDKCPSGALSRCSK